MSSVNVMAREVAAKIVFYGPGLSGKTTTLRKIHQSIRPSLRGEMISLPTEADRTLFFDFLPLKVDRVGEFAVRLALYTVPGQVFYNATRKLVLQGADGVVFVVDSNRDAEDRNRESLENLEENLLEQGIRLDRFPLIIQYNKRDMPNAVPLEELRSIYNPRNVPDYETSATSGRGVLETLKAATRMVIKDLRSKRVVPPARVASGPSSDNNATGLEVELQHHIAPRASAPAAVPESARRPVAPPRPSAPVVPATPPSVQASAPTAKAAPAAILGPASALSPSELIDYARAADSAFSAADYANCVRACIEAVRRGLSHAGDHNIAVQGFLLNVHGPDLLRLMGLDTKITLRVDDAAFALSVLMQVFTRLQTAGLADFEEGV